MAYVRDWIAGGAPWPEPERLQEILQATDEAWNATEGVQVLTSGGLSPDWTHRRYAPEHLWAYQPIQRLSSERQQANGSAERNPIDLLLEEKFQKLGIAAAPPASRREWIRRATFDLTGLPPTPEETQEFLRDPADDAEACAKVVERLLASPHYGEKWGRHWLDVVRYADSSGFANDYERGNAWRYRDYVVRAFNDDKPYDQFIREQLAGDEIDPGNPELLVAVGFLRMGPWELTSMEVAKVARQRFLDDVTDAVGQVFLGHMLQCARCHDHKFDPVPTRDYYAMQAIFATTQLAERTAAFLSEENTTGFDERKYLLQRQQFYQHTLQEVSAKQTVAAARLWYAEQDRDASEFERVVSELTKGQVEREVELSVNKIRQALMQQRVDPDLIFPRHVGFEPVDFGKERIARKGLERLRWRLERYEPLALSVYSGRTPALKSVTSPLRIPAQPLQQGELEQTAILTGGDPFAPAEPVKPGVLSAVRFTKVVSPQQPANEAQPSATEPVPVEITGRRLALADWIASPGNPLTARVLANRLWQWHFGRAIAGNPNNFGATGQLPTHPELLDELAGRLIDSGWSIKQMHRLIMNSEAYRRSATHPDSELLASRDPEGISYAVFSPRRLTAEELRDAMLAITGELNPQIGGIPARPEMNPEAALQPRQVMGTFAEAWQPAVLPEQRHRRSLYALRIRGQSDPFLDVFNAPSPELSCEQRESSTITPQVFTLFNSEASYDRALALADRLLREATDTKQQPQANESSTAPLDRDEIIERLFELVLNRAVTREERTEALAHWQRMTERHRQLHFDPPTPPQEVLRNAVEENTGERFTFAEPLEYAVDFVPDLKPAAASPECRGLAELCLVLFNSNEFAHLY